MATSRKRVKRTQTGGKVRYAVIGLGYIAQAAMLPAFRHARQNSQLTALISEDALKLRKLGKKYGAKHLFTQEEYFLALHSGEFDAIYIALPNSMHAEYAIHALEAGIHVLCEKPMAPTVRECENMITAARRNDRRLMIAYRLHFDEANLEAIRIARSGKLGDLRFFSSVFSMNVRPGDIRVQFDLGGGPVADIGIYCINAARYLFRDEPREVHATAASLEDRRFTEVPEMVSATLTFPGDRIATFTCSFNAAGVSEYRLVGTRGELLVEPAYEYTEPLRHRLTIGKSTKTRRFKRRDQFAPELIHFSDCILNDQTPGPSGEEGLADVRIMQAIALSIQLGKPVPIAASEPPQRPTPDQVIRKSAIHQPKLVGARQPMRAE